MAVSESPVLVNPRPALKGIEAQLQAAREAAISRSPVLHPAISLYLPPYWGTLEPVTLAALCDSLGGDQPAACRCFRPTLTLGGRCLSPLLSSHAQAWIATRFGRAPPSGGRKARQDGSCRERHHYDPLPYQGVCLYALHCLLCVCALRHCGCLLSQPLDLTHSRFPLPSLPPRVTPWRC